MLCAAMLIAEHYAMHPRLGRKIPPPVTYIIGLGTILFNVTILFIDAGAHDALLAILFICAVGGAAVMASYWYDNRQKKKEISEDLQAENEILKRKLMKDEQASGDRD